MWLFQLEPKLFLNRFDGFTWVFMKTAVHQWLTDNAEGWIFADTLFYSVPLIFFLSHNVFRTGTTITALLMLLINWIYIQCYTLYPSNSIEAHTAWLLLPVAFLVSNPNTFRLLMEGLRYFFLFILVSAGIWKIISGAVFNLQQMSGVLLYQHADLLSNSPDYWQANLFQWLIDHQVFSYILYLFATIFELLFIAGFFTKKYDRLLIIAFIVFVICNHLLMRIPYYELLPFLITLRKNPMHPDLPSSVVQQQNRIRN